MAKESNSLYLQLEILRLIPKRSYISTHEIQQKLEDIGFFRDIRSIQRQLKSLSEQFDIECNTLNKPYSYRWKENAKGLDLPILNEQQSLVLMLAKQHLKGILPANIMHSMESFFKQAEYNLVYDSNKKSGSEWLNKVAIAPTSQPLLPAKIEPEIFAQISTALYQNRFLQVHYRSIHGKEHKAQVKPLALVQQGSSSYLVAQYEHGDILHLALHRLLEVIVSTMQFKRPDFNLKAYVESQKFGFSYGRKIRLTFRVDKAIGGFLTETPLSVDQNVKDCGSEYEISATVIESEMLNWWIAHFGENYQEIERVYLEDIS